MFFDLLLNSISRHINLTTTETERFVSVLQNKKIRKKQLLYQEGDTTRSTIFVTDGLLRIYSIDKNGFEHVLQFAPAGWWVGDVKSFINQQPGTLYVDALEDSDIITIQKGDLDQLYNEVPKFERYFRILGENAIAAYQHRLVGNLSLSAAERYNNFCQLYPTLIQNLPQKQVAAYIGVTPEFLSKMLNQPGNKK